MILPLHRNEEPNSKTRIWYHWFNIRIRQYMVLETLFFVSLIMIFYRLQTIFNQNNQVIEMVSSMKSQMSILERKVATGKPNENSKPLEQSIADVLKKMKMEQSFCDSNQSKSEKKSEKINPPLNLNLSISKGPFRLINAADYLSGASVDSVRSSSSSLNPFFGYDQSSLVLLDRPQPPTDKAWCSNERKPVLTINLAKYIKPISVSYQHLKSDNDTIPNSAPKTYDVVACRDFYCENWKPLASNCVYSSQSIGTEQFCNISSHLDVPLTGKVQFRFRENYGDSNMTCVSSVRVYGETDKPVIEKEKNLKSEKLCADLKYYYHNRYFEYSLVNKSCSALYGNDCCSDCPECCEECLISDYNRDALLSIVFWTFIGLLYLWAAGVIMVACYGIITGKVEFRIYL
ncbi:unnamed protein product [Caenorhabditis nigoni]